MHHKLWVSYAPISSLKGKGIFLWTRYVFEKANSFNLLKYLLNFKYVCKNVFKLEWGFPCGSDGKEFTCNVGDLGLIPGLGRSPAEGNGYPLQYSCLENSMDRGTWQATVHGVSQSWTRLSNFHFHFLPVHCSFLDNSPEVTIWLEIYTPT